jgi:hypothetical protein
LCWNEQESVNQMLNDGGKTCILTM